MNICLLIIIIVISWKAFKRLDETEAHPSVVSVVFSCLIGIVADEGAILLTSKR
jgi:hypothetical protein